MIKVFSMFLNEDKFKKNLVSGFAAWFLVFGMCEIIRALGCNAYL